ncbi:MAG: hypothetical protein Q8L15_18375 [Methylobacter sp.]|nr:hypothetical protein [Methylobacter sp.]
MTPEDYPEFHEAWIDSHAKSSSNQTPSDRVVSSVFDDLVDYPLSAVKLALGYHARQSRFAPTPHDVVVLLESGNKRLSADEAWAMMPKDEFDTVVWTQEMAEAYNIAYELIVDGDKIAARMAFKGAYERLCAEAVMMQRPVKWTPCIGYDKTKIETALQKSVLAGRITQERANKYLPAPVESGLIAGLISGKVTELPANNENLRARWGELGQALADGLRKRAEQDRQRVIEAEEKRFAFEQKKQDMLDRVGAKPQVAQH